MLTLEANFLGWIGSLINAFCLSVYLPFIEQLVHLSFIEHLSCARYIYTVFILNAWEMNSLTVYDEETTREIILLRVTYLITAKLGFQTKFISFQKTCC